MVILWHTIGMFTFIPINSYFFFLLIEWTNISAAGFFNTSSSIFTLKLAPRVVHLSLFCLTSLSRDWNNNDTHSKKSANNVNSVFHLLLLVVAVYFTAYFLKRFCKWKGNLFTTSMTLADITSSSCPKALKVSTQFLRSSA